MYTSPILGKSAGDEAGCVLGYENESSRPRTEKRYTRPSDRSGDPHGQDRRRGGASVRRGGYGLHRVVGLKKNAAAVTTIFGEIRTFSCPNLLRRFVQM